MRNLPLALISGASMVALGQIASAADLPVKAPPAAVVTPGGYYVWVDGMYERVRLPTYSLGFHILNDATFTDGGPAQRFDPRLNGGGVRGAIGYILPGSTTRFEFGGSYVAANGSTSAATPTTLSFTAPLMNGALNSNFNCIPGSFNCTINGNLSTDYDAWQLNGKVAAAWTYGSVTLTPSAAIFGGISHADQTFSQNFIQTNAGTGALLNSGAYTAATTLRWTDIGARAGLDISVPVTPTLVVGIGGWLGFAERRTSLNGNDSASSTPAAIFNGASALSTSDNKGVFLANVEAGLAYRWTPAVTLRGFVGLNYDNSVPGIAGPTFTGPVGLTTSRTPASIYYAHETSWYAGGGVLWKFGG